MSIINSLKTFSKKAFNVEPKGSNIDEVLDDMASKVTPGSGGGNVIFHRVHEDTISMTNPETGDEMTANVLATDVTMNEVFEETEDHLVLFLVDVGDASVGVFAFMLKSCTFFEANGMSGFEIYFTGFNNSGASLMGSSLGYDQPILLQTN